jgi:mono/diheme cytochrome c family protein
MRRLGYLLLALLLAMSLGLLASCGDDDDDTTVTEPTATEDNGDTDDTAVPDVTGADGEAVFANNCASCHGAEGAGGTAPALAGRGDLDENEVETIVRNGGGGMPAFEGQLEDDEIDAVVDYVVDELATE